LARFFIIKHTVDTVYSQDLVKAVSSWIVVRLRFKEALAALKAQNILSPGLLNSSMLLTFGKRG